MARDKSQGVVTIANGTALSGAVNLGSKILCAITVSAAWTAAALSFQASDDGGATFYDMFDAAGVEISIVTGGVVAGQRIAITTAALQAAFQGVDVIKVRSGLTGAPVNQGAARVLTLVARKVYGLD